jgi:hypothetical protein
MLSPRKKVEAVVAVLAGARSREDVAAELGVRADEVETWTGIYLESALHHTRAERALRPLASRRARVGLIAAAVCAVLLGSTVAFTQGTNCTTDLTCFDPDTPAKANEVNANFTQLKQWITAKVGNVLTAGVQTTSIEGETLSLTGNVVSELRAAAGIRVRKSGNTSTINFDAQANDPGSIIHYESSNTGELWLSSSDDWDAASANDRIVFGQYPSYPRFEVKASGNARVFNDLSVDGEIYGKLPVYSGGTSGSNVTPEVYEITDASWIASHPCDSSNRGRVLITRPSAQSDQDSLCYCGLLGSNYEWWCFNP